MIFWKEWRETLPLILLSAVAVCVISHFKWDRWRIEFFEFQFWVVASLTLVFFIPFLGATAFAGERENDTLDVLLARPVGLSKIFFAKYIVRWTSIVLLLLALMVAFLFLRPTHNIELYDAAKGVSILLCFLTFSLTVSFLVSCFSDTSPKAYVAAVALVYMTLFILNSTRFFKYAWWWRESFDEMWLEYSIFYATLSLIVLAVGAILFGSRLAFTCSWKHLMVVGILIFFTFVRSVSTTFWLAAGIATSGDLDLIQLVRQPLPEILENISRHDQSDRAMLRQFLITSHNPRLNGELAMQLESPEATIRNEAVRVLTSREAKEATSAVLPLLKDPSDEVKHSALLFMHILKCEGGAPEIIKSLDDSNSSVRSRAVHALGAIMEKDAGPYLMEALNDPNPLVHTAAAYQLCRLDYTEAQEEIVRMMLESPIRSTRQTVTAHLGMMKSAPACDALISVLTSDDTRVVERAIYSLGNLQCKDSVELLMNIRGDVGQMRLTRIYALRNIGGPRATAALRDMFADDERVRGVKLEAALALAELGDLTGIPFLREYVEKRTQRLRLVKNSADRNTVIRLARAGEYVAVPALIELTKGRWPATNYRYGKMLEELTGRKYGWDSKKWTRWWEKNKDELLQDMLAGNVYKGGD